MTYSTERFRVEEKIRLCLLKYRWDVIRVSEELGYQIEYVQKIAKKLKKRFKCEENIWTTSNVVKEVLEGVQQRSRLLQDKLVTLIEKWEVEVSICCNAPTTLQVLEEGKEPVICCLKCMQKCQTKEKFQKDVFNMSMAVMTQLRRDERHLAKWATGMGFVQADVTPPVVRNIQSSRVALPVVAVDIDGLDRLEPMERVKLFKKMEAQIKDAVGQNEGNPDISECDNGS